ncbi:MAG: alpha-2-macroglobulin, partial [Deltaproteobacteria bacterium]|nr:alpha-2-macroglobulin [Deltaproteobacteria bacterium]
AGLTALDGSRLAQPYTFDFQTPSPEVQNVAPREGYAWLAPDQTFTVLLNQPVRDLAQHAKLEVAGKPVPLTVAKEISVAEENRAKETERHHERASFEERGFKNRQTRYELKPASALPLNVEVRLTLDGALPGKEGPLTLGAPATWIFFTYGPFTFTDVRACTWDTERCSWGPLVLLSTNKVDVATLKGKLTIEPAAEIDWDNVESYIPEPWSHFKSPYVVLAGRYKPGTQYKVKVAPGVADEFKQVAPAFSKPLRLDDLEPSVSFGPGIAVLEAERDGALPVESVNANSATASVWTLSPEELAPLLAWEPYDRRQPEPLPARPPASLTVDLQGKKNAVHFTPLKLRETLPEGQKSGLFLIKATSPDVPRERESRVLAQVTDLAVHAKLGARSGALWVTRLSKGTPVENAQVRLLDKAGAVKWEGMTDATGVAKTPGLVGLVEGSENSWQTPFALAVAELEGDIGATLSEWDDGIAPSAFNLPSEWDNGKPRSLGLVFADRGVYRPGDEVFLKGLARFRQLGEIQRPKAGTEVQVTVNSSRGTEVFKGPAKVSDFGTFGARFPLPKEVPLGTFQIVAELQVPRESGAFDQLSYHGSFRVEEYRPPQFRVDVITPAKDATAGDDLSATVLARYLFGGAMSKAQVHWTASRTSTSFTPPGNDAFSFGVQTWWWDDEQPSPSSEVFGGGDGETDATGSLQIKVGKAEAPAGKTWEYTVEAEVSDVNRQRLANRASLTVHPASVYAGLRTANEGFAEAGKPVKVELVAASPDGKRQAGVPLALEVKRRDWKSIKKKGVGGQWFTESEAVETRVAGCEVKSEATPVSCDFKVEQPGLHVLEVTASDSQGRKQASRISLYAVGSGWVSWQRNDTDRIDLVPDKQAYDVGETARILVKSPYPEADALLTVEREGVFTVKRVKLKGAAATLEVPLDESLVPNAFVGVVISRGRVPKDQGIETGQDPGRPAVRVGYVELRVQKKSKQLTVTVTPDATEKRPRDKVKVAVNVADYLKKPAKAEVTLWAVDEGVLRLTAYQRPDLVEAVHPLRGLSVRLGEPLIHLVLSQLYGEKGAGGTQGGSGGSDATGAGFRSRFKTTVAFETTVTDERGVAHVEFELPDNLTTYRIMAVATTAADQFGGGQAEIAVSKPLLALPALPRSTRVGDIFDAGVVVHTKGAAPLGDVKVTAEAQGLKLAGPAEQTVPMADGKPKEVRFHFVAETAGTATLRFAVQAGNERDGVEQKLPVTLPVAREAVATYGDTTEKHVEGIVPPGGIRPDVGGLEVTLSSTMMGNFDENMRQLVEYPYGCVEQLSSRLVPFIALREIQKTFGLAYANPTERAERERALFSAWLGDTTGLKGKESPDEVVRSTVRSIQEMQNHDGGFRYWPGEGCSQTWASSYAVLALYRAREAGFAVDSAAIANGQKFLADTVAANRCVNCGWGCPPPGDETRIFALYSLARTRAPKSSYYGELFGRRGKLPLFSKAMLADAMFVGGGDRAQAKQLLTELLNHAKESAAEVHFEETDSQTYATLWSSDTRTTAIVLQTLTDIAPEHPFVSKIGRYLVKVRKEDGQYRNTQEAAFSLMALSEVLRTKEKDTPDFVAKVTLGAEQLAAEPFKGRSMEVKKLSVPIEKLAALKGKQPMTF